MKETLDDVVKIVKRINVHLMSIGSDPYKFLLEVRVIPYNLVDMQIAVLFLDSVIWNSADDMRDYDRVQDCYYPLDCHLMGRIKNFCKFTSDFLKRGFEE